MDINKIAKEVHQTAKEKGWWEKQRNKDEIFMLMLTELAEAVEADRKDRYADISEYNVEIAKGGVDEYQIFEAYIKDTVEDEIADTYIRCADYLFYRFRDNIILPDYDVEFGSNFAENIFKISKEVCDRQIPDVVRHLYELANHYNFNLEWHVLAKMKYNNQREYKHGGKKY